MRDGVDGHGDGRWTDRSGSQGEAALLLVESLIHGLIANSGLTIEQAIEIVQVAVDTQIGISDDRKEPAEERPGVHLLSAIAASLALDAGRRTADGSNKPHLDGMP